MPHRRQRFRFIPAGLTALNAAFFGLLRPGDHVVTTAAEHNSVLRPLHHLADRGTISWTVVPVDRAAQVSADDVIAAIRPETRMVCVLHAANVNGAVQPVLEIGDLLGDQFDDRTRPIFLCDAAQSFGYLPISVDSAGIDVLAAPGHKGGVGPLGTGFLYVASKLHSEIVPSIFGGTGTHSESLDMPNDYPSGLEAGNQNVPALAGWLAGLRQRRGDRPASEVLSDSEQTMRTLAQDLYRGLSQLTGIEIIGAPADPVLPVASITVDGVPASEAAMILDSEFGIEVRSGLHCAPLAHGAIGSPDDGTLRISCGESTTESDLASLSAALSEITAHGIV